ncbi:MAG: type II CAAX endopeptidase family protein [Acidobacteriota bacterium]
MREDLNDSEGERPFLPFLVYLILFFGAWIIWVLEIYPLLVQLRNTTLLYALINILLRSLFWVLPVFLYLRFIDHVDPFEYLKLRQYWKRGVVVGLGFFALNFALSLVAYGVPTIKPEAFTWNSVVGTSVLIGFIEEIPFRGFILQKLQERMNFWLANLISSVLFLLIHFPGWISLNLMTGRGVILVFVFGFVMAMLLRFTKSLWSSIVAHSSNDFLAFSIFRITG